MIDLFLFVFLSLGDNDLVIVLIVRKGKRTFLEALEFILGRVIGKLSWLQGDRLSVFSWQNSVDSNYPALTGEGLFESSELESFMLIIKLINPFISKRE